MGFLRVCFPPQSGVPGECHHPQQTGQSLRVPDQEQHCKVKTSTKNTLIHCPKREGSWDKVCRKLGGKEDIDLE